MKKTILLIMDGWGIAKNPESSAIDKANVPFIKSLDDKYPKSKIQASGEHVGLPKGQMGNSEVGHMNLGAGRVVYQDLAKIDNCVEKDILKDEPKLQEFFEKAKNKKTHFIGLVSDGGVHSHIEHLKGLLKVAKDLNPKQELYIHAFTDGRDCDPKSGISHLKNLNDFNKKNDFGKIASVIGRYYAMDRDKRWERVQLTYNALTNGEGKKTKDIFAELQKNYDKDVTDEFIKPIITTDFKEIEEGDAVLMFNFRTDRGRQLTEALTQYPLPEHNMKPIKLQYATLTNYNENYKNIDVIFNKDKLQNTIGEVLAKAKKKQIRIAETEKYPHVTFFFSGGEEKEFKNEKRILCSSPKVATYDLKPEMSAYEITDSIIPEIKNKWPDFVCLNFANPDMVGHTGSMAAAIIACETVNDCVQKITKVALHNDYTIFLLADHGNSDCMLNPDGSPNTAHTTQPVPFWVISHSEKKIKLSDGKLGDIAPTILKYMGLEIPKEMDGDNLISF